MSVLYSPPAKPEDIIHFKYIDKIRTNGGWRYIYDEVSGKNARKQMMKDRDQMLIDQRKKLSAKNTHNNNRSEIIKNTPDADSWSNTTARKKRRVMLSDNSKTHSFNPERKLSKSTTKYNISKMKYDKHPVLTFEKNIEKGKKFLKKVFG